MDHDQIQAALKKLPLGEIRYFPTLGSTNDAAAQWAMQGAPQLSLVIADEQTAGRGRDGRTWHASRGASLTFSLILYPDPTSAHYLPRLTALGAVAVKEALKQNYDLPAQIKWPNDVLIHRQKISGVLAEAQWDGDRLQALVLGIGINVAPESLTYLTQQDASLNFPAACVESVLGKPVDRLVLLKAVLEQIVEWQPRLSSPDFLRAWEIDLAFRGEWVQVSLGQSSGKDGLPRNLENRRPTLEEGKVLGLYSDGALRLLTNSGEVVKVGIGEVRLRPSVQAAHPGSSIPGA